MEQLQQIVQLGWFPVVLAGFAALPARRAVLFSIVGGWLILPPKCVIDLPGFIDIDRHAAANGAALLGALLFAPRRLLAFRPRWLDLPAAVWCLCPAVSAVSNSLGPYEAVAASYDQCMTWGAPYFLARAFLNDRDGLRELAVALVVAGACYAPLCLFEVRMSPKLSGLVYGDWRIGEQDVRLGGWRPRVFLSHGLELGMFMVACAFVGFWSRASLGQRTWLGFKPGWWVLAIGATALLCKSSGAILLGLVGSAAFGLASVTRLRIWLVALVLLPAAYIVLRTCTPWSGRSLVAGAKLLNEQRAGSLQFRLDNEDILIARALKRPLFGWGRFGRFRVLDVSGNDISTTDGRWVLALGECGIIGLIALVMLMLTPAAAFLARFPIGTWTASLAPAASFAALLPLRMVDMVLNDMPNPTYLLIAGCLTSVACSLQTAPTGQGELALVDANALQMARRVLPRRLSPGHSVQNRDNDEAGTAAGVWSDDDA